MARNWGIPPKSGDEAFTNARREKPFTTMFVTAVFGVIGASISAIGFSEARGAAESLFRGWSLAAAVVAAGFGCWAYIWIARPRFAAHFGGPGDAFADLVRFYAKAAISLIAVVALAFATGRMLSEIASVLLFCVAGGAGAAAAFQTVLAFVPDYRTNRGG